MAIQSARTDGELRRPRGGPRDAGPSARPDRALHYRLDVLALDAADAARAAGGWLFDRAMAGWQVRVLALDVDEARPMQILGARVGELHAGLADMVETGDRTTRLAVSSATLADAAVRDVVHTLLRAGGTEIAMWGDRWPDGFGVADPVGYRLSAAARIFKTHALAAAGVDGPVGRVERLQRGGHRPIDSDLLPLD